MILWVLGCVAEPPAPVPRPAPAPPPPVPPPHVVTLQAGEKTTCVLRSDGTLECWGALEVVAAGVDGELEVTDTRVCVRDGKQERCWLPGGLVRDRPTPFVEVAGDCGRDADGAVWCKDPRHPDDPEALIPIETPAPAVSLVVGPSVCALLRTGELGCFTPAEGGAWQPVAHEVDELDGTWLRRCWRVQTEVTCRGEAAKPPGRFTAPTMLAVGRFHTCVLDSGQVVCRHAPWEVPGDLGEVRQLTSGDDHVCALLAGDVVRCWGSQTK